MGSIFEDTKREANGHLARLHNHFQDVIQRIDRISDSANALKAERFERNAAAAVPAGGAIDLEVGPTPPGHHWVVILLAVTGTNNGPCAIYTDAVNAANLVYTIADADLFAPDGPVEIYVREGSRLIFRFTTQTVGATVTAHIQGKQYAERAIYDAPDGAFEDTEDRAGLHRLEPQRPL